MQQENGWRKEETNAETRILPNVGELLQPVQMFKLEFPAVVLNYILFFEADSLALFLAHDLRDLTPRDTDKQIARQVIVSCFSR